MTDLVIGASGQVGGAIVDYLKSEECEVVGTYTSHNPPHFPLTHLDISDKEQVNELIARLKPKTIYLPSSYTNVDGCERDPELSHRVNVQGAINVFEAALKSRSKVVYFSSDYVFDGVGGPYKETDKTNPVSVYGQHKLAAENACLAQAANLVIRTTVVYGVEWQGKNFVIRLLKSLLNNETVKVPDDQVGNPTLSSELANVSVLLAQRDRDGIFNVAGTGRVSRYEFAREAAYVFGLDESLIEPVKTESLAQAAKRPLNAGLVMDKVLDIHQGRISDYKAGLKTLQRKLAP
ncbi:MAG: SDR family oxidoreductase [Candidatus Obscuribacter sp.]|jgi:dTDP-4-dehydrorhamnose reductase|nr:SDR family oxidoreductase [Candidatus Obscuribacter sp.]MBP7578208.1 SDR family oxidoreductase [Candidatus Obscuribacter sp.]